MYKGEPGILCFFELMKNTDCSTTHELAIHESFKVSLQDGIAPDGYHKEKIGLAGIGK